MPRSTTLLNDTAAMIVKDYRSTLKKMKAAMKKCEPGSTAYLNHLKAIFELGQCVRRELVERGLECKNLGLATTPEYSYVATIDKGTAVVESAKNAERRAKWDEEFGFTKTPVPAAFTTATGDDDDDDDGGAAPAALPAPAPRKPRKPSRSAAVTMEEKGV